MPAANGAVVYLNTGDNLQPYLDPSLPMAARSSCRRRRCRRAWVTMRTSAIPKVIASACSRRTDHGPARTGGERLANRHALLGQSLRMGSRRPWRGGRVLPALPRQGRAAACMRRGDWIVYYSLKERLDGEALCQQFTAIGQVSGDGVYVLKWRRALRPSGATSVSWKRRLRRSVRWWTSSRSSAIPGPLGLRFALGVSGMSFKDFALIAQQMLGQVPDLAAGGEQRRRRWSLYNWRWRHDRHVPLTHAPRRPTVPVSSSFCAAVVPHHGTTRQMAAGQ